MSMTKGRISALMCSVAGLGLILASAHPAVAQTDSAGVGEVIVTATKRQEKVREVVGSVGALSGVQLQKLGAQSLQDYILSIPGVTFNAYQPGNSPVVIRGVASTTSTSGGLYPISALISAGFKCTVTTCQGLKTSKL